MPRLQQFSPPLQIELVNALNDIGVKTDTALLLFDDPTNIFRRLPPELGVSLLDFQRAVEKVVELAAAPSTFGDKLLEKEEKRDEDIFVDDMLVGVPELDALLGGFNPPKVIEVSGDKGSGKTVCLSQIQLEKAFLLAIGDMRRRLHCNWCLDTSPARAIQVSFGSTAAESSPRSESR